MQCSQCSLLTENSSSRAGKAASDCAPLPVRAPPTPSAVILLPLNVPICCWPEGSGRSRRQLCPRCPGLGDKACSSSNVTFKLTCTLLHSFASCLIACEWHASYTSAVTFWLLFSIFPWNTKGLAFYFHVVSPPYFGQVLFILRVVPYTLLFRTLYPFLNVGDWVLHQLWLLWQLFQGFNGIYDHNNFCS